MNEALCSLNLGNTIEMNVSDLPEFWKYVNTKKECYTFNYSYPDEKTVQIKLVK